MLLGFGFLCVGLQTNASLIIGGFAASIVSVYLTFDILARSAPLRLSAVLAFTLGLGYGLGTLNTWFTLPRAGETLGEFLGENTPDLSLAMGGLLIAMALLLAIGELYEKPLFGEEFRLHFNNRAILLITVGSIFRIGLTAAGASGGFGSQSDLTGGHVSVLSLLAGDLQNPLFAFALCAALNARGRFTRWYLWIVTALLFLTAFPLGRRAIIYSVLLGFLALRFGDFKVAFSPLKKIILSVLLVGFLYIATIGFFYFRVAGYSLVNPSLSQRVTAVISLIETQKYSDIKEKFSQNVERRTFIIGFLSELIGYTEVMPGGHGNDLLSEFELSIPSVFYPQKDVYYTEEQYASSLFGAEYGDQANSVLTTGTVDFGFWGLLIYPLLTVFMFRYFLELCGTYMPPFAACFVIFLVLGTILEPEVDVTAYFISIREGIIIGILVSLFQRLPDFRIRNVNV